MSDKTVRYRFVATGVAETKAAYRSITDEAEKMARRSTQTYARASVQAQTSARKTSAYRQQYHVSDERALERAAAKEARIRERALQHVSRIRDRHFAQEQRSTEKHERQLARANQKAHEARARMAGRVLERVGDAGFSVASTIVQKVASVAFDVVKTGVMDSFKTGDIANRVSINARQAGEGFIDARGLKKGFEETALATPGIRAGDIGEAVQQYIALTGNSKAAIAGQGVFATAASASGADVKDIATALATLGEKFDVTGIEDMQQAIATLTFQGKAGAFEIKDMAAQFQRLAASADAFDIGKGAGAVATLGGIAQIARRGTGSARMATTATENIFAGLTQNRGKLEGLGVGFEAAGGGKRNVTDILIDTIAKVGGGNMAQKEAGLLKIFGKQGIRGVNPLIATFGEAFRGAKGNEAEKTAAGMAALRKEIDRNIATAGSWSDIEKDAAQAQKSAGAQIENAWQILEASVSDALVPALEELAPKLPVLAEGVGAAAGALVDFVRMMGSTIEALQDAGIIAGPEATKAPKNMHDVAALDKDISKLEKKGEGRTDRESERLQRMKDIRSSFLASRDVAPILGPAGPTARGFGSYKNLGATPLTGIDAVANVAAAGGGENQPTIDTSKAQQSMGDFAAAASAAAKRLSLVKIGAGASGSNATIVPEPTIRGGVEY